MAFGADFQSAAGFRLPAETQLYYCTTESSQLAKIFEAARSNTEPRP